jgi:glycosyltransferase involved in cell wall biosynthesis
MKTAALSQTVDSSLPAGSRTNVASRRLAGKHVAMVVYSSYPNDPRPRRAVSALVDEGATVDLITLAGSNGGRWSEQLGAIHLFRIPIRHQRGGALGYGYQYTAFILISSFLFAIRSLFRRYDLVYVHNMPDVLVISALFPKLFGAKVVLDQHDPMPELMTTIFGASPESRSVRILKWLEKWSIARADLVVTVNVACKRIFSTRSCRPEKIAVVMNAPDGKIFPYRAARLDEAIQRKERFAVMYHGSIVERNGLDLAIDAITQVRDRVPNVELRVFGGSTPFLERMKEVVRERNLEGTVRFLGTKSLEEIVREIQDCDLGVIPNHYNAFTEINTPTRIFEYLALGTPAVSPATSGIEDYFDKDSMLFFEPGNPADLARVIEYAFHHPEEIASVARKGQQVYLQHTWENERETLLQRVSGLLRVDGPR